MGRESAISQRKACSLVSPTDPNSREFGKRLGDTLTCYLGVLQVIEKIK